MTKLRHMLTYTGQNTHSAPVPCFPASVRVLACPRKRAFSIHVWEALGEQKPCKCRTLSPQHPARTCQQHSTSPQIQWQVTAIGGSGMCVTVSHPGLLIFTLIYCCKWLGAAYRQSFRVQNNGEPAHLNKASSAWQLIAIVTSINKSN